jgi:hypothetical protein
MGYFFSFLVTLPIQKFLVETQRPRKFFGIAIALLIDEIERGNHER